MLNYEPMGPDRNGEYAVIYLTPGTTHCITVAGICRTAESARRECDRLNEAQVLDRRTALVERANRISHDLPRKSKGEIVG